MNPRSDEPRESRGEASDVPREGDIIAGRYRVERVLGQGGMGVVVAARHTSLRQRVAVKFLRPAALKLPGASARFLREAQAAAAIQSEHVARVTDMGTLGTGSPFMVMEHLDGTDLSSTIKTRGPLSIKEAVDFVLQACEALAEAHKLGIVHRDLKPSNIFVTARADGSPLIKVLDFGLSKVLDPDAAFATESSLTNTEMVVGSPHYMSPEHVRSLKYVDARTDIWSLGVILYQLLTARRPFDGDSLPSVFAKIVTEPPDPLRRVRPEVPQALEAAILCCLEKDVTQRFQTISEFARAIAPFGPETSRISAERIERVLPSLRTSGSSLPAGIAAEDPTTASVGTWARTKVRSRRRAALALAAGGAAAVGAIITVVLIMLARDPGQVGASSRSLATAGEAGTGAAVLTAPPEAAPRATAAAVAVIATVDSGPPGAPPEVSTVAATSSAIPVGEPTAAPAAGAPTTPATTKAAAAKPAGEITARPAAKQGAPPPTAAPAPSPTQAPKQQGSSLDRWD
jgi:serine/threonine-protein kinase